MLDQIILQLPTIPTIEEFIKSFEPLLVPFIDTTYFGCPDNCIVEGSSEQKYLDGLFSPIIYVTLGIGFGLGLFFKFLKQRKKQKEKIRITKQASRVIQKQPKPSKHKQAKKQFLQQAVEGDPQQAYLSWIESLDPKHPQTARIKAVHTDTKEEEIVTPEQKMLNTMQESERTELQEDIKKVEKLMKEEHLTEDQAIDKLIGQAKPIDLTEIDEEEDKDIFKQDIPKRKYPNKLIQLERKLKIKQKKPKQKHVLTDLGVTRRNQYAKQIEKKLLKWTFPMPTWDIKNTDEKIEDDEIVTGMRKLALFLSMAEFMVDRKFKKKRYWRKINAV